MKYIFFTIISFIAFIGYSFAQPGNLDKQFGDNGKVTDVEVSPLQSTKSALQKDQKLIVAYTSGSDIIAKRYLTNGSVDLEFGDKGIATTHFENISLNYLTAAILIQPDQKIIVITSGSKNNNGSDFILTRYEPDGLIDSSFGNEGIVVTDNSDFFSPSAATAAALLPDGSIVIGGHRFYNYEYETFFLRRYLPDGKLNTKFGDSGIVDTRFTDYTYDYLTSLVYQKDGKIIAGGFSGIGAGTTTNKFALCRYLPDGQLDKTFGNNGKVITDLPKDGEELYSMFLQSDGRIVAAGSANFDHYKTLAIARYNDDGSLDKSFGQNGSTQISYGGIIDAEGRSVNVQTNGKIVVAGNYKDEVNEPINSDFLIVRFTANGTLDSGFGENGSVITDFGEKDYLSSSALQDDGKIVCAGEQFSNDGTDRNLILSRYIGDPVKQQNPLSQIKRWLRKHILNWQGLQSYDVAYYSIEQSSNGINGFKEIGRVKSVNRESSNVNEKSQQSLVNGQYSFDVSNITTRGLQLIAEGSNYYRIRAVNNDGSNVFSDVISDESFSSITVSPNPVKDVLKISGWSAGQKSIINIISRNGNVLQSATCNNPICNINVAQLHSGLYNVQVVTNGKTQTVKFVKE